MSTVDVQKLSYYTMNRSTTSSGQDGQLVMLLIPMLVLSYAQKETIFSKDPTIQIQLLKIKNKKVMTKKTLIVENTNPLIYP